MSKPAKSSKPSIKAIRDKERRLIEQNQADAAVLKKLPPERFMTNRFGPLLFAMAFGVAGLYFAVMSFAAPAEGTVRAANLSIEPSARVVPKGETIVVRLWADSLDQPVAAVRAKLTYPADKFELVTVDTSSSAFSDSLATDTSSGSVLIDRAVPSAQSLIGRQLVAKIVFRATSAGGSADMRLADDSHLLRAADRTNILKYTNSSRYYISALYPRW